MAIRIRPSRKDDGDDVTTPEELQGSETSSTRAFSKTTITSVSIAEIRLGAKLPTLYHAAVQPTSIPPNTKTVTGNPTANIIYVYIVDANATKWLIW